jgi:Peptidase family M1 domain/Peptidase M1 N-terminal domain/Dockerin type I domain
MPGTKRLTTFYILTLLLILTFSSLSAELLRSTQGTLQPPTDEKWQTLLENRQNRHACMIKTEMQLENLKAAQLRAAINPTTNQYRIDVLYYKMDMALDFSGDQISGYVESRVKSLYDGLNTVEYNFSNNGGSLNVTATYLNGSPVSYDHSSDLLTIFLGQSYNDGDEFDLKVDYNGSPDFDGNDGLRFYTYNSSEVAYTNCEPWGARLWWPCKDFPYDKPDSMDIIITHPSTKKLVSNGVEVSITNNGNGTYTTHWHEKYPIATYLVQLGCTNYTVYNDTWQYEPGQYMPIVNYSYPGIWSGSQYYSLYYMLNYTEPSLEALSYYFTLYPFVEEKYGHNHYGWGGAMEHQTLTSISPNFDSEYVIAHELGHQWSGDKITCIDFHHMWLNEGFASYSEALYFRYHYGEQYYKDWMNGMKHLDASTPYVEDLVNDDMFDNITVYDKGAWVVYMLHQILGDSLFLVAMDNYFNDPGLAYGAAHTLDLQAICSDVYGSDMGWFFNAWVYNHGNPDYRYSYQVTPNTEKSGYDLYMLIKQIQPGPVFTMPIDVRIFADAYDTAFTVFNNQRGQVWTFNIPNDLDSIWVDRDEKILRSLEYDPDFSMSILAAAQIDTAYIGVPYYAEYFAVGGLPEYSWRRVSGQFPYGLTFHDSTTAYIEGTPSWTSNFVFSIEATDSDTPPSADTITLTIVVLEGNAPDEPVLILPANDSEIDDVTPEFVWSSTAGAGGTYTLQYATNLSFSSDLITVSDLTNTTYTPSIGLDDGIWYWHVEALNDQGTGSDYQSSPFSFILDTSPPEMRGDCNNDGEVNVSDAVWIVNYVFVGGAPPSPLEAGDTNCDSEVNVSDAVHIINYVFVGGPQPCNF